MEIKTLPLMLGPGPRILELPPLPEGDNKSGGPAQDDMDMTVAERGNEDRSSIMLVAKTVPSKYWKLRTFPIYTGTKWERDSNEVDSPFRAAPEYTVDVVLENLSDGRLPGPGHHLVEGETNWADGTTTLADYSPGRELTIHFDSSEPDPSQLEDADETVPAYMNEYVDVEVWRTTDLHCQVAELADELKGETRFETIANIMDWLRENCLYTDEDSGHIHIPQFLLETQRGTCQQFAGSAALLMRFCGHPTRCVGGFTFESEFDDELPLLATSAHAWIEVWWKDAGWVTFDPTDQDAGNEDDLNIPAPTEAPPPIEEYVFKEPEDVDPWARVFARDLRQIISKAQRPRYAGAYETGGRINSAQLYKVATKDSRFMQRRNRVPMEPAEIIYAVDESISITHLPMVELRCYERSRWMVAEGLRKAEQDFAFIGFKQDAAVYKDFGQPWDDAARTDFRRRAAARLQNRVGAAGTNTAGAVEKAREIHARAGRHRHRYLFILTDGEPNSEKGRRAMRDYIHLNGPAFIDQMEAFERRLVREQVELAHSENMTVVALIITTTRPGLERDDFLKGLEDMFDRSVVLGNKRQEIEDQLRFGLLDAIRGR